MFQDRVTIGVVAAGAALLFGGSSMLATSATTAADAQIVVSGLNDPRGLTFGPGGDLFIAEAGSGGGTLSTAGLCDQIAPPVGPALGGNSARVLRLSKKGTLTAVASGLPSAEASPLIGGDKQGVSDVATIGNQLFALVHDLFATLGDHTYTSLASDRDDLYVGTLGQIAFGPGGIDLEHSFEAGVYRLARHGAPELVVSGLHAVVGVAFDRRHRMYVLQSPIFIPGTGSLVRIDENGQAVTILDNLVFPSSLRRGPDHALYFSECSFHCQPGDGRVLRVAVD